MASYIKICIYIIFHPRPHSVTFILSLIKRLVWCMKWEISPDRFVQDQDSAVDTFSRSIRVWLLTRLVLQFTLLKHLHHQPTTITIKSSSIIRIITRHSLQLTSHWMTIHIKVHVFSTCIKRERDAQTSKKREAEIIESNWQGRSI